MKSITSNIVVLFILSIGFISCAQNTKSADSETSQKEQDQVVSYISSEALNKKAGDIQLIDVRTPQEYTEGYIKNAVNINFYSNGFLDEMSKLDKNKALYIYCRSGGRSGKAAKQLEKLGFTKVYDLQGGMKAWQASNFEVTK